MHPLNSSVTIIFDCDGVIFDSNNLKVDAMGTVLRSLNFSSSQIESCLNFFSKNFGKSRYFHVDVFLEKYLAIKDEQKDYFREKILNAYSVECRHLYTVAKIAPFLLEFLAKNKAVKFIASGSEQEELRQVIKERGLNHYFDGVFGSPTKKVDLVADIISKSGNEGCILIGDSHSDLEAARTNHIDFIYYSPYSNVDSIMRKLCKQFDYKILSSFQEVVDK
ncbi:HAD family hydrolase [Alteromonas sp. BMJM2]|uniref:HAD family hydrolase n=1 Tax=Alteromonas sp. BMJM2 TaxID=2954241 RepID=UPI0022B3126E|nr:HAD hydrolase-like protein [Alteromonas sp. BMJM2]